MQQHLLFCSIVIAPPIKPCQKMPLKIKFIKDDDERILPYCEEEDAEKFYFQQILTARFSWGSNNIIQHLLANVHTFWFFIYEAVFSYRKTCAVVTQVFPYRLNGRCFTVLREVHG
jgi:hypothetical protein